MNKLLLVAMPLIIIAQFVCTMNGNKLATDGPPSPRDTGRTIAHVSWDGRLLLVASGHRAALAARWNVEDPDALNWRLEGPHGQPVEVFVAEVPDTGVLDEHMVSVGDLRIRAGVACTDDRSSGSNDTGCTEQAGGGGWRERTEALGYGYSRDARPEDRSEEVYVQVGDWIYYSDRCRTEVRRVAHHGWVCFPR